MPSVISFLFSAFPSLVPIFYHYPYPFSLLYIAIFVFLRCFNIRVSLVLHRIFDPFSTTFLMSLSSFPLCVGSSSQYFLILPLCFLLFHHFPALPLYFSVLVSFLSHLFSLVLSNSPSSLIFQRLTSRLFIFLTSFSPSYGDVQYDVVRESWK